MASTTFQLSSVAATDPITLAWNAIDYPIVSHLGLYLNVRFRRAVLYFPVLTSAQYAQWLAYCDNNTSPLPYMPRRTDGTYILSPEIFSVSTSELAFDIRYRLHFLGSQHGERDRIHDTRILAYMVRVDTLQGGGG